MECSRCGTSYSLLEAECPQCHKKTLALLETDGDEAVEYGRLPVHRDSDDASRDGLEVAPDDKELQQIWEFVFHSPHVQRNSLYSVRVDKTSFIYDRKDDAVNSIATEKQIVEDIPPPCIILYAGLARVAQVLSAGLAGCLGKGGDSPLRAAVPLFRAVGHPIMKTGGFSEADALQVIDRFGLANHADSKPFRSFMFSLRAAMIMSVLSHEVGHIALGHTMGTASNDDVRRNMEREADSFASSIISTSPFADHLVAGAIFFFTQLSWTDAAAEVSTHPRSRERLFDYIRENEEQAENLGLSMSVLETLIPG